MAPGALPQDTSGLVHIVTVLCRLGDAERGAIVRRLDAGRSDVLAHFPEQVNGDAYPEWLKPYTTVLADALKDTTVRMPEVTRWVRQPEAQLQGLVWRPAGMDRPWALVFESSAKKATSFRERFTQTMEVLSGYAALMAAQSNQIVVERLTRAITVLSAINKPRRFLSAAMTLCNELASEWACERVSLGMLRGRYVRLRAISHSVKFSRKMKVAQLIEAAMEECLDQDVEVLHPAAAAVPTIRRAAAQLGNQLGAGVVLSVPLRLDNQAKAVVTLEWPLDRAPDLETVAAIRLVCNLCAPRLLNLHRQDRWWISKMFLKLWDGLRWALGPRHIAAKLAAMALMGLLAFMILGKGTYRAQAPFVMEATTQQSIVAPFDGYIKEVHVEIGDVVPGDEKEVLAILDTAELRLDLAAARAERAKYVKEADAYMQAGPTAQAQMQMAQAEAERMQAQIDLLSHRIQRATVTSPIVGTITQGDLKRHIGAPVKTGDLLFEVTPLESLRAVLLVSEERIHELTVGQKGSLATASYPDQRLDFEVEMIYPAAEVLNQRNIFRVRARFDGTEIPDWMRPGMEGVSKVEIGKRRWIYIWTRKLVNWIRMTLWI
jgi:biotin carboxyl carrier protein